MMKGEKEVDRRVRRLSELYRFRLREANGIYAATMLRSPRLITLLSTNNLTED
jgi:hypothetical protein